MKLAPNGNLFPNKEACTNMYKHLHQLPKMVSQLTYLIWNLALLPNKSIKPFISVLVKFPSQNMYKYIPHLPEMAIYLGVGKWTCKNCQLQQYK